MKRNRIKNFLLLQCSMLLLLMVMLPQFDLLEIAAGIDFNIIVICCKLVFCVFGGIVLFRSFNMSKLEEENIPLPFFVSAAVGFIVVLLSVFNVLPMWLEYLAIPAFAVALFLAKSSLKIEWNKTSSRGAYFILLALVLHLYKGIDDASLVSLGAIVGLVLYWVGLGELKTSLDKFGVDGCSKLKIAVILALVSIVIDFIPLMGWLATILVIIAFILEFIGYGLLARSESLSTEGRQGAKKLRLSMIILLVGALLSFIPFVGGKFEAVANFIALFFVFLGWSGVLLGLESETQETQS